MTERPENLDPAERIRRLQERRAASGRAPAAASTPTATKTPSAKATTGKRRRRHPAGASRILLAGMSLASFFTIGGTLMLAQNNAATVSQTTPSPVATVGATGASTKPAATSATSAVPAASSATSSTHAAPTVHTTTRAS